jgi:hypothetical protein
MTEIFANFEVNKSPWWPRMARLLGGSFALHLILASLALYIPAVRSMLNLAGEFGGVNYVDADYRRTQIGERATIIELSQEKFQYPEGYFMIGKSPEEIAALQAQQEQAFMGNAYVPPPIPVMPKFQPPEPVPSPTPSPTASPSPQASPDPNRPGEIAAADSSKPNSEIDKQLNDIAAQNNVARPDENQINKRPLKDWLARANDLKVKGELDLNANLEMVIEAERDAAGKLHNAEVVQKTGDPRLTEVAKDLVGAISDSGILMFLNDPKRPKSEDVKRLRLTVKMDQNEVVAMVESEAESPERAQEIATGYNGLLTIGQLAKKGQDEEVIYKNTKVSANGKQIVVNFTMPRTAAADMLKKQLPAS